MSSRFILLFELDFFFTSLKALGEIVVQLLLLLFINNLQSEFYKYTPIGLIAIYLLLCCYGGDFFPPPSLFRLRDYLVYCYILLSIDIILS